MKIIDFMICTGTLAECNYILVPNNEETILELKEMGCSDHELEIIKRINGEAIDVYPVLTKKGYKFEPQKGFYK